MRSPSTESEPRSSTGRRRRWLRLLLVLILTLPLIVVSLGALALHTAYGRAAIFDRVSRELEEAVGIRAQVADFSLRITQGVLTLDDITLSAPDAPGAPDVSPFLSADGVRVEFDWAGLLGTPTVLRSIVIDRPVADLGQPLPPSSDEEASSDEAPPEIDVHELRLNDGRLASQATQDQEAWLRQWIAEGVDLGGSYLDGQANLELRGTDLTLDRARDTPIEFSLATRLAGPPDGPFVLEGLRLTGDGLRLDGSAELGTEDGQPLLVRVDLDADPSLLLAEIGPGGSLHAEGEIDLRRFRGELTVRAKDFPSEALEPWIGEAARPGGRPSSFDLDADLSSDPDATPQVTGEAELTWRQDDTILAEASLDLTEGRLDEDGIVLESLIGEVHAMARDVPAEFLRPMLGAALLERAAARGTRLDLDADLVVDAAAPARPSGQAEVTWRRGGERLLRATAKTIDAADAVGLAFTASLLPAQDGRRELAGSLDAPSWPELAEGDLRATTLDLDLPDLADALDEVRSRWPLLLAEAGMEAGDLPEMVRGALESTVRLEGPVRDPRAELDGTWRPDEPSVLTVTASGRPLQQNGEAQLTLGQLDLALLSGEMQGRLDATITAQGSPDAWTATVDLDGSDLRYGTEMPAFEELRVAATSDGKTVDVTSFAGRTGASRFTGDGGMEVAQRLGDGEPSELSIHTGRLRLNADEPFSGIDHLDLDAHLEAGVVRVTRLALESSTGPGELEADVPLGALAGFGVDVGAWPVEVAEGRIKVDLDFPSLDVGALITDVGQEPPWTTHVASLTGRVWLDPAELTAAEGELLVETWLLEVGRHRLEVGDDPILLALADHRLDVVPVTLVADGHDMDFEATLDLAPGWQPGDEVARLVTQLAAKVNGVVEGGLLTPYLLGGVAEGPVAVRAEASGPPEDLTAHATVDGRRASVVYATPYVTQIAGFEFDVGLAGGEITVDGATAQLNGGPLELDLRYSPEGDVTADVEFEAARFRLDYGLTTLLNGDLRFELPAEGAGSLRGEVDVDRAVQRRDIKLDREILNVLFAPPEITGAGDSGFDDLELDLTVTTAKGFQLRNNLVDVRGGWSTLTVQGTLAEPAIEGRIEIDPGGYVYAYGRTARLDQGAMIFTGEPGIPPEVDVEIVWDFEDVTVSQDPLEQMLRSPYTREQDQEKAAEEIRDNALTDGLTDFVGAKLGRRLGGTRVRVQPVLVFGETDPSAKLVISRDLSAWIAFAVAVDLRDSQRQTYVLDLHKLKHLPRVSFQLFTENGETDGVTVQQTLPFGKARNKDDSYTLGHVFFETPFADVSQKRLRGAVGYSRGEALPEEAEFEVEVNLSEYLRGRGYPDARVDVVLEPVGKKRADLAIAGATGPHVRFEFEGQKPPSGLRRSVTEPYRVDFYESASRDEMRQQMVRALRSQGYLEPQVEIETDSEDQRADRAVTIRSEGGRKVRLDRLTFEGVDPETGLLLRSRFATLVARIELAMAEPGADAWLERSLRSQGYPEARILSRRLSEDGRELTVGIESGPRQQVARVAVEGPSQAEAARLLELVRVKAGDPPRADLIVASNLAIRNDLKHRGYAEVRVRSELTPAEEGSSSLSPRGDQGGEALVLVYRVEPGPQYRIGPVRFAGLGSTREAWARKLTDLDESEILDPDRLDDARRQLFGTRLFRSVRTVTDRSPEQGQALVSFEVEESPRYQLSYGLRWESRDNLSASGPGSAVVVDVLDRNFFGRGVTVGVRGLYGDRDQAVRFYASRSNLFGRRLSAKFYFERRSEETLPTGEIVDYEGNVVDDSLLIDSSEGSLQVGFPIGQMESRVYLRYKQERTQEKIPLFPDFPFDQTVRFPFTGWQLILDRLDDRVAPTRGIFLSTDLSATGDYIGSDFDFIRFFGHFKWMVPVFRIGSRQVVWAQSYRLGLLTSQDDPALPGELFRAGGERSVRGYETESLVVPRFPDDPYFEVNPGGEAMLVVNQELRFPVWSDVLGGLVFFDVGNAWGEKSEFGSDLFKSVGVGVRAQSPIGLLRLDFAFPLDRREMDDSVTMYFGFGHAF